MVSDSQKLNFLMCWRATYSDKNLCLMLLVKKGTSATSSRGVFSQVSVCNTEVKNAVMVGSSGSSIFDSIYSSMTSETSKDFLYQKLARIHMKKVFPTQT